METLSPSKNIFFDKTIFNFHSFNKIIDFWYYSIRYYSQTCLYDHLFKTTTAESTQANSHKFQFYPINEKKHCLKQPLYPAKKMGSNA